MPPEPLPWDHERVFKDHRKHHRGAPGADALRGSSGGGSSSAPRWRETYYAPRDFPGPSPRRPLPGQHRQGGGYQPVHPEDPSGHGFTPLRSDRFRPGDETFRSPSSGRYGGGGGGRSSSYRDGHGTFRRSPYLDSSEFSTRQNHEPHVTAQRSVATPISSAIQTPLKDLNVKTGGGVDDDGLGTGRRFYHRDHSDSWKPSSKWSRPGSLCSTKTGGSVTTDIALEVPVRGEKKIPSESPVTSLLPSDEDTPQKKPRLGWGQGLARYEKQKVEGSADTSESGATGSLGDVSPKVAGLSLCLSPSTPCSANCSFSPGFSAAMEDKPDVKPLTDQDENCYKSDLTGGSSDDAPIKCNHIDSIHANVLSSLLSGLEQPDDVCSRESALSRHTTLNNLLLLKEDISKELEKTECVIDLFENELKVLDCGSSDVSRQSKVAVLESSSEPCEKLSNATCNFSHLSAEDVASTSCIDLLRVSPPFSSLGQQTHVETKYRDEVVSEQESTSSRCHQSLSSILEASNSIFQKSVECFVSPKVEKSKALGSRQNSSSDRWIESLLIASENANKDDAEQASVQFDISLSVIPPTSDIWELNLSTCRKNDFIVKEKLAVRKRLIKFKEKVLILKFRALQFLWKEDLRLLSCKKHRIKSNKNFNMGGCVLQSGTQKQRTSVKSTRFSLLGNLTLVPNTEILDFTSKLLLNSEIKLYRNDLKMPTLILDEERMHARFVTHNGLIEDPSSLEQEKTMINPWSQEEKEVFMELLATFGKDFSKISYYLQHKTTADCIEFYYKYHKSESFKEVKKRLNLRKTHRYPAACTYLVPLGKKWNTDVNVASIELPGKKWKPDANVDSLDLLGAASTLASHNHITHNQHDNAKTMVSWSYNDRKMSYEPCNYVEKENNIELVGHVAESLNANTLGAHDASSSEIISSYVTGSPDRTEKINQREVGTVYKTQVYESFDEDSSSDGDCSESDSTDWTDEEKSMFIRSLYVCGKDFARIASCVGTRSREQCKIFYSKAQKCLGLDKIHVSSDIPMSDANGGRSGTNDACIAEMDSAICNIDSCSKLDAELSNPVANIGADCLIYALQTEAKQDLVGDTSLEKTDAVGDQQLWIGPGDMQLDDLKISQFNIIPNVDATSVCVSTVTQYDNAACDNHEKSVRGSDLRVVTNETAQDKLNEFDTSFIQHDCSGGSGLVDREVYLKPTLPEGAVMNREKANNFSRDERAFCSAVDSDKNEIDMLEGNKSNCCPQVTFVPNYQHHVQLDLHHSLPKMAQDLSLNLENAHSSTLDTSHPDLSSISFGRSLNTPRCSTLNFEGHENRQLQNVANEDFHEQFMTKTPPVEADRHLQILRGHPLQLIDKKKKRDTGIVSRNSVLLETHSNKNGMSHSTQIFLSEVHGNNHNSLSLFHSGSAIVCPLNENQPESEIQPSIQNAASDTDTHRSCDVKLFGTVLSHSSSLQNLSFSAHEGTCSSQSPVPRSSNINPSSGRAYASSCKESSFTGPEEQPVRSFAFENIMQAGLSSLSESTDILSKYHGSLAAVSPRNNGLVPHLSSEGKHLENCGEMQKKNGSELISGFQPKVKPSGMCTNVVAGGVSAPVPILQLRYAAQANNLGGQV